MNKLDEFFRSVGEISEVIAKAMKPVVEYVNNMISMMNDWFEDIKEYLSISDRFDKILIDYNWPPIRELSHESKKTIVEMIDSRSVMNFDEVMIEIVKKEVDADYLNDIQSEWKENSFLDKRQNVLNEAISAHNNGLYYSSTIILLSQLEGVIADGFYHNGFMNVDKYKKYIRNIYNENPAKQEEAFKNMLLDRVLVSFKHGEELNSSISRHAIMHGADVNYGTFENSIKLIFLMDFLQYRFSFFHIEDSKVFHRHGCHYIERTNKKVIGTKSLPALVYDEYEPCKICMKDF